jgi:putative membrane protein
MPKVAARHVPVQLFWLSGMVLAVMAWSAWRPHDWPTWFLEAAPVLLALPLLAAIYRRFPFTTLAYWMVALHAVILLVGAHYTYAEVPLFNGLRDAWGLGRNHYDRIGHIAQGFFPAILIREILLRRSPLVHGKWLLFIVTCIALAISAFYELIEWWVALAADDGAVSFLGTQGDPWDTQWDMCLALCGALAAQWLLGRAHDRQLKPFLKRNARRN